MTAPDPCLNEIQARRSSEPCDRHDWCAISDIAYLLAELRKAHEALERVEAITTEMDETAALRAVNSDVRSYYATRIRAAVVAAKGDEA